MSVFDELPTLKSPSVAKITRLFPFLIKFSCAVLYANSIPAPPAVLPPASSFSKASIIVFLLSPEVGGKTIPAAPAYTTMETLSSFLSSLTKIFMDCFSKGNLLESLIEPETSIKKTRLEAGNFSVGIIFPCNPIFTSLCFGFHGASLYSVLIENR
ncbi:hypothetical protein D9M68_409080 [compost metagenome]